MLPAEDVAVCLSLEHGVALPETRAEPVARGSAAAPAPRISLARAVEFQSQLSEAPPPTWAQPFTPYCAAAASIMVMRQFGLGHEAGALAKTFAIGRLGNTTDDPGLDPTGIAHLMRAYGGEGRIHASRSPWAFVDDLVGRLNHGVSVVALTEAGNHTVTVFGYEAVPGGEVTGLYVADPLSGYVGLVGIDAWFTNPSWMGQRFRAAGPSWREAYVFVTYRDFR